MTDKAQKRRNAELEELAFSIPNRVERMWNEVKFPLLWSCAAFVALGLLVGFATTPKGGQRLAGLPFELQDMIEKRAPGASLAALLDRQLGQYRAEAVKLANTRASLEKRIASLEENYGDITASIPKQQTLPAQAAAPVAPNADRIAFDKTVYAGERSSGALTIATRSQFGIELGTDRTMGNLRTRWVKLMEQFGTIMTGYEPLISASDGESGVVLHLVVGPFSDAQEAAQTCAKLRAAGLAACAPVPYDGQRMALR